MHHVTVKLLQDRLGNIILFPSKRFHGQIKDRVNVASVLTEGVYLQGFQVNQFLDELTVSQRRKVARDANSMFEIGIRLDDEYAWALFGAAY